MTRPIIWCFAQDRAGTDAVLLNDDDPGTSGCIIMIRCQSMAGTLKGQS